MSSFFTLTAAGRSDPRTASPGFTFNSLAARRRQKALFAQRPTVQVNAQTPARVNTTTTSSALNSPALNSPALNNPRPAAPKRAVSDISDQLSTASDDSLPSSKKTKFSQLTRRYMHDKSVQSHLFQKPAPSSQLEAPRQARLSLPASTRSTAAGRTTTITTAAVTTRPEPLTAASTVAANLSRQNTRSSIRASTALKKAPEAAPRAAPGMLPVLAVTAAPALLPRAGSAGQERRGDNESISASFSKESSSKESSSKESSSKESSSKNASDNGVVNSATVSSKTNTQATPTPVKPAPVRPTPAMPQPLKPEPLRFFQPSYTVKHDCTPHWQPLVNTACDLGQLVCTYTIHSTPGLPPLYGQGRFSEYLPNTDEGQRLAHRLGIAADKRLRFRLVSYQNGQKQVVWNPEIPAVVNRNLPYPADHCQKLATKLDELNIPQGF